MAFVEFQRPSRGRGGSPFISVNKDGIITISKAADSEFFKDAEAVIFLYDAGKKSFALKLAKLDQANSYRIRRNKNMVQISAGTFFREIEFPMASSAVRYSCRRDEKISAVLAVAKSG